MRIVLHIVFFFFTCFSALSQRCYTDDLLKEQLEQSDEFRQSHATFDSIGQAFSRGEISAPANRAFVEIPVVVHVLWRTEEQNISDKQIMSQIHALNRDFNMDTNDWVSNPEPFRWLADRANIRFALANIDQQGNPTTGIIRKNVSEENIGVSDDYYRDARGGSTAWTRAHYLNIWVGETNDSILGYAIYPNPIIGERDGIFMNYRVFGIGGNTVAPYNQGRTLVHEVGHYFGLRHPWGGDSDCSTDDYIDDTPRQEGPNFSCQNFPSFSCPDQPHGDLYMNYMDYASDACINMFTRRQVSYMHLLISTLRSSLYNSSGLSGISNPLDERDVSVYPNPTAGSVIIESKTDRIVQLYSVTGVLVGDYQLRSGQNPFDFSSLSEGVYILKTAAQSYRIVVTH